PRRDRLHRNRRLPLCHAGQHRAADSQPDRTRPRMRPRLCAHHRAGAPSRHGAHGMQRLRPLPEPDGPHSIGQEALMTTTAVTVLGVIAPTGLGVDDYWKATLEGRNGIAPITKFDASGYPSSLAGQVVGFHAADHLPGRLLPQTDHMTRMALAAAQWAWD